MCNRSSLSGLVEQGLMPLDQVDATFVERARRASRYRQSKRPSGRHEWPCGYRLSRCRGYWRKHFQHRLRSRTRVALAGMEYEALSPGPERYAREVW